MSLLDEDIPLPLHLQPEPPPVLDDEDESYRDSDELWTVRDALEEWRVSTAEIAYWVRSGELTRVARKPHPVSGRPESVFRATDIMALARSGYTGTRFQRPERDSERR